MNAKLIELLEVSEKLEEVGYQLAFTKTANNNLILTLSLDGVIRKSEYLDLNFDDAAEYKYQDFISYCKEVAQCYKN